MSKLKDLLPFVSYTAKLQVTETEKGSGKYVYVFGKDELMTRSVLEEHHPELLDREIADGIHGEGNRDGLYIHLYK